MRTRLITISRASALRLWRITIVIALAFAGSAPVCLGGPASQTNLAGTASSVPWQKNQIIKPETLAKSLSAATGQKPLVICVGFPVLYQGGHIVGAKFAGPASKSKGIQALKREVKYLPRDKQIVLYCGCCPWNRCPNIRPAFFTMQDLGFTNVKVLSIPENFREDWVGKGFPIVKGADKQEGAG
ncbi:MAG TPA: rhodanese-like domain-containing protein [Verrucomicrobiae bacterium]|nr:rhodanese-like domain-containing protein [Verrucomicrobiae bacterium]